MPKPQQAKRRRKRRKQRRSKFSEIFIMPPVFTKPKEGIPMKLFDLFKHRYLEWNEYQKLMDTIEQRETYPKRIFYLSK